MNQIKQYKLSAEDFEVVVEINHGVMTDEMLHVINNFWSEAKWRLAKCEGNVIHAVLGILYRRLWWSVIELGGSAHIDEMVRYFKDRLEGWPPMDGSYGIKFISFDSIEFDYSPDIEEVSA
jgi:hypothetical protein